MNTILHLFPDNVLEEGWYYLVQAQVRPHSGMHPNVMAFMTQGRDRLIYPYVL